MGKKTKTKSPTTASEVVDSERATEVADLKRSGESRPLTTSLSSEPLILALLTTLRSVIQGNNQFAEREYQKALDTYDKAVKMLPEASAEKADILCNKAACYIQV